MAKSGKRARRQARRRLEQQQRAEQKKIELETLRKAKEWKAEVKARKASVEVLSDQQKRTRREDNIAIRRLVLRETRIFVSSSPEGFDSWRKWE